MKCPAFFVVTTSLGLCFFLCCCSCGGRKWKANQEPLLLLADKEIDFDAFKEQMKFVDTDGNIINGVDEVSIGKFVNGFAICKKGEKYNYITQDGSYLFKEYILDSATNINHYDGNIFLAYVSINGRYFYIDSNGKEIDLY